MTNLQDHGGLLDPSDFEFLRNLPGSPYHKKRVLREMLRVRAHPAFQAHESERRRHKTRAQGNPPPKRAHRRRSSHA